MMFVQDNEIRIMKTVTRIVAVVVVMALCQSKLAAKVVLPPVVVSICEADTANAVIAPDALLERLNPAGEEEKPAETEQQKHRTTGQAGWRVQVFSDNNSKTAKNEARVKEQKVLQRFPQYRTYKKYSAPYWRVRVGDFKTSAAAESAAAELRRAFPAFAKEIRVVRDRINPVD